MIITGYKVYIYDSPNTNDKGWWYSLSAKPTNWIRRTNYLIGELTIQLDDNYSVRDTQSEGKLIFRNDTLNGGMTLKYALDEGIAKLISPDPAKLLTSTPKEAPKEDKKTKPLSVVKAPQRDTVTVNEAGTLTVLFPRNSTIVKGETQEQSFLFVEPEENEEGLISDVQFRLSTVGETVAWFDLDLEAAEEFFNEGRELVKGIQERKYGDFTFMK